MRLSIVVVTRDTCAMTLANARRALEAAGPMDAELVVVDNGSTDGTAEALARELPAARVIPQPRNLGYARAANLGARASSGELVLFLNSDAQLTPQAAKALVATFLAHPRAGAVGAFLVDEAGGRPQHSADGIPTLASEFGLKPLLRLLDPRRFPVVREGTVPVPVPTLVGACMAVRREAFDAVGGFDERFFVFLEETDLCLRLAREGWEVLVAPAARVVHAQGATARRTYPRARLEYDRSRLRFFLKHRGRASAAALWALSAPRLAAGALLNGLAMLVVPRLRVRAAAQGYRLAWHLLLCPPGWGLEAEPDARAQEPAESVA